MKGILTAAIKWGKEEGEGEGEEERVEEGGEEDMVNYHDFGFKCFL